VKLTTLTRVRSDHCPLLLDDGSIMVQPKRGFRFEPTWISQEGFKRSLIEKWPERRGKTIRDFWKIMKKLRQLSRGMGPNLDGEIKRKATKVLQDIKWVDERAEAMELDEDGWRLMYELERELENIYTYKESIWQKRCDERWILQEDANTGFFHCIANGRKKKCTIHSLEIEKGEISDLNCLREHIKGYCKMLFGREERWTIRLEGDFWGSEGSLSKDDGAALVEPFSKQEIKAALSDMNSNFALGPDGLPAEFYKCFWD
jgi:hypothetical protein